MRPANLLFAFSLLAAPAAASPKISVTPASLDFGKVPYNTDSLPLTVTLGNSGDANLEVHYLSTNSDEFRIANPPKLPLVLSPNASFALRVVFHPTNSLLNSETMTIDTNDPSAPFVDVPLTGIGTAEYWSLSPFPPRLSFGIVDVNDSVTLEARASNSGDVPITIQSISIEPDTGDFRIATATPFDLAEGSTKAIPVTFSPTAFRDARATLSVVGGARSIVTHTITLEGFAQPLEAGVTVLHFGAVAVGARSAPQSFTIKNVSTSTIALSLHASSEFLLDSDSKRSLGSGATTDVSITYAPRWQDHRTAVFAAFVEGSALWAPRLTIDLDGEALPPPTPPRQLGACQIAPRSSPALPLVLALLFALRKLRRRYFANKT